jgi:hypothetical protein
VEKFVKSWDELAETVEKSLAAGQGTGK